MINSKQKGNQYERDCVNWLNEVFKDTFNSMVLGIKKGIAFRTPRSGAFATQSGLSKYSGDALTSIEINSSKVKFDFKFYKRLGIYNFWNKHKKECATTDMPVLIIHANNERDHLVVMERNDWAILVDKAKKNDE